MRRSLTVSIIGDRSTMHNRPRQHSPRASCLHSRKRVIHRANAHPKNALFFVRIKLDSQSGRESSDWKLSAVDHYGH